MVKRLLIKVLFCKLKRLTVAEVCWLLKVYSADHTEFYIKNMTGTIYAASAHTIHHGWEWIKETDLASLLPVRFWGGPADGKGGREYYNGTFVTLAIDRILYSNQTHGVPYRWLLKFDEYENHPIWKQLKTLIPNKLLHLAAPPKRWPGTLKQKMFF